MYRTLQSALRYAIAIFAACTLMISLGCGDVKPDHDATGDTNKPVTQEGSDREAAGKSQQAN